MTEKTGRIIIRLDGGVICIGENNKQSWRGSSVGRATKKWSLVGDSYSNDFKLGKPFVVGSNPTERDSDLLRSNSTETLTGTG